MAEPGPVALAIRGRCPRCGSGPLFSGAVAFAGACTACGLDYTRFNVGDGATAFIILIVGAVIVVAAIVVELRLEPAWWVHVLLWGPLTLGLCVGAMRLARGALLALEYAHDAREGRS